MCFIEMVTIQMGGVTMAKNKNEKKKKQSKQQNKPETGNPKLDDQTSLLHKQGAVHPNSLFPSKVHLFSRCYNNIFSFNT